VLPSGLLRQYSLCGPRADRSRYAVAVLRVGDGRGGSIELHDGDLVGQVLEVRGPRNNFPLVEAPSYLLFAGGIGVTPMLAMARELDEAGREWSMVYGGRSLPRMAFLPELESLGAERVAVVPQDTAGIPDFAALFTGAPTGTAVYCCGPEPMIAAVEALHDEVGGHTTLHVERFAASAELLELAAAPSHAFEVVLKRSGHILEVPPGRSVLEVVRTVVPSVEFSCSEGICGSCEIAVLEGEVDHRDGLLTEDERESNATMMICVSRARADRLVLDL
jgi:ferredoxin-NADP reductase